jgi:hypothetical protein
MNWISALFKKTSFYIDDQLVDTVKYCDQCKQMYPSELNQSVTEICYRCKIKNNKN